MNLNTQLKCAKCLSVLHKIRYFLKCHDKQLKWCNAISTTINYTTTPTYKQHEHENSPQELLELFGNAVWYKIPNKQIHTVDTKRKAYTWSLRYTLWQVCFINHRLHLQLQMMQTCQDSLLSLLQCLHTRRNWWLSRLSTETNHNTWIKAPKLHLIHWNVQNNVN